MLEDSEIEHWAIVGAGSMGLLWASYLAQADIQVSLIHRPSSNKQTPLAVTQNTTLEYDDGETTSLRRIKRQTMEKNNFSHLVLCVKSFDVKETLLQILPHLSSHTTVVLIQNGMAHLGIARQLLTENPVFIASMTHGAFKRSPLHVVHSGRGHVFIGTINDAKRQQIQTLFKIKALATSWEDDIEKRLWHKLIINSCINPLTALLNCKNGQIESEGHFEILINQLINEALVVACTCGQKFNFDAIVKDVYQVIHSTTNNFSSMLQDIQKGQLTEIDAISGFIIEKGIENAVDTPTHRTLYLLIKSKESLISLE